MKLDLSLRSWPSIKLAYRHFLNTEHGVHAYGQFKQVLYTDDDSLVQVLDNNVLQHLPVISTDVLNVCDIGGGDGKRIRRILKFLRQKFDLRFKLDFVEQSSCFMCSFATEDIDSFCETHKFEMLFEDASLPGGYDITFLIHSIFAFENGLAVDKVLSLPNAGGSIVVISNAEDSFLAGFKKVLDADYNDRRFEITDLLKIFRDRGIKCRQIPFETKWAIPKEHLAQHTEAIVDWLSLGRWTEMTDSRKEEVGEYIRCNSLDLGHRVLFAESEVIVLASPGGST